MVGVRLIGTGQAVARRLVAWCGLFAAEAAGPRHGTRARGAPLARRTGAQAESAALEYLPTIRRTMR
jgi:hypothetical protein